MNRTIAVTGLNATDNPGPGVGVIRALRHNPSFRGRIVGLAYDALEPGIYAKELVDHVFLIPYPSQGVGALEQRLEYIHSVEPLDVLIPTLDAELPGFIELSDTLRAKGIGTYLPTQGQLDARTKARLPELRAKGLPVPNSRTVTDVHQLAGVLQEMGYPAVVKGPYYGAKIVKSLEEATRVFYSTVAEWGYPVIAQEYVAGDELCVLAVGDGEGGQYGAVHMRKTVITDKGKGWAGVAIRDVGLDNLASAFFKATHWRGPCELEVIRDNKGNYQVLEVNPRFPAWCYLSAGAGMNLPYTVAQLAAGDRPERLSEYKVGTMFVRIAIDQIADMAGFSAMTTSGESIAMQGV